MKALFFLSHPAHFHLFKNIIENLKNKRHSVIIVVKAKDILENLLKEKGWDYFNVQPNPKMNQKNIILKSIFGLLKRNVGLAKVIVRDRPAIMMGTEWSIANCGWLFQIPNIIVNEDDTDAVPENKFFYPFAKHLLLPDCCDPDLWNDKKITYSSYHELAYLHPKYFKPDKSILGELKVYNKPYYIIRLVSLSASHDINRKGISFEVLEKIIALLSKVGRVFITSEKKLPQEFEKYRMTIPPSKMHHVLYYADMYIGDSQTMATEAAVLGVPSLRFNDFIGKLGCLEELEHKYVLTHGIKTSEPEKLYQKVEELLNKPNLKQEWQKRRQKMLSEKIDVTAFIVWFIENYPESVRIMKENPVETQRQFL